MENVAGEQGLALQQLFPYKSSYSLKVQTVIKSHSLMMGASNLLPFLAFVKLGPGQSPYFT